MCQNKLQTSVRISLNPHLHIRLHSCLLYYFACKTVKYYLHIFTAIFLPKKIYNGLIQTPGQLDYFKSIVKLFLSGLYVI
jgi:hypothetical protein